MEDGEKYRTYKIPEGLAKVLEEALYIEQRMLELDSNVPRSVQAHRLDALESILGNYLCEARPQYWVRLADIVGGAKARTERLLALERDGFRCVICGHSNVNAGAVESHHIIPKSALGRDQADNLASLCSDHHRQITNPTDERWHWRNVAPRLFELIGVSESDAQAAIKASGKPYSIPEPHNPPDRAGGA